MGFILTCETEPFANLLRRQAGHANHLIPAGLAGSNSNGGAGHLQKIPEEFNASVVGFAVDWRGGERKFEGVADLARDGVFLGAGVDSDLKRDTSFVLLNRDHLFAQPKELSPRKMPLLQ